MVNKFDGWLYKISFNSKGMFELIIYYENSNRWPWKYQWVLSENIKGTQMYYDMFD